MKKKPKNYNDCMTMQCRDCIYYQSTMKIVGITNVGYIIGRKLAMGFLDYYRMCSNFHVEEKQ